MARTTRGTGFRRLGEALPADWPPSRAAASRLALEIAWRDAVGGPLAEKARCLGVRRGVLEIETADARWAEAVRRLLPRIAAKLAARSATRKVRRFRLVVGGERSRPEALPEADESIPSGDGPVSPR